jgi:hypothetical protein
MVANGYCNLHIRRPTPVSIVCLKTGGLLEVKLNKLARVIAACWAEGEFRLIQIIAEKHPNASEELITDLLAGELRASVAHASCTYRIDRAFLEDLHSQIPNLSVGDSRRFGG